MSEVVTVKSINGEGNPWQHGITYWPVTFDRNGQDFSCSWGKKGDPPQVDETVEGDFTQRNGEWKFKKASAPPQGTSSSGSQDYGRGSGGGKSPDTQASIVRQHSQEMGLRWASLQRFGEGSAGNFTLDDLADVIDWFETDANKAASGAGQSAAGAPSSASSPAPSQNGQAIHERITVLLEAGGVNDQAARTISDFALTEMTVEEQDAAIGMLENESRRMAAIKRLTERTEAKNGQPLPRPTADDSIPF